MSSMAQLKIAERNLATELPEADCSQPQSFKEYTIDDIVGHKEIKANMSYKIPTIRIPFLE